MGVLMNCVISNLIEEIHFFNNNKVISTMEKAEIFHNEPKFYGYNIKRLLLVLVQIFFQLQYFILSVFVSDKFLLKFMNIATWIYISYLFTNKYNLIESYRFSIIKDQVFLTLCFYMQDIELILCIIPCLLISTVLYGRFNWDRMKMKESILESSLLMIISLELMIHIIHRQDVPYNKNISKFGYI